MDNDDSLRHLIDLKIVGIGRYACFPEIKTLFESNYALDFAPWESSSSL